MFGSSKFLVDSKLGYKSLVECIMDHLKHQLDEGGLKPGDEINVNHICDTLKVSRTPVREALIQLVSDGFVELISRRKYIIKRLTLEEIQHIYQVIGLIETETAKIACQKMTDADIRKLDDLYNEMEASLKKNDAKRYFRLNFESHTFMSSFCENPILKQIVRKLKERLYEYPKIEMIIFKWDKKLMSDHKNIIKALKRRDEIALEQIIKNEHWNFKKNYPFLFKFYEIFDLKDSVKQNQSINKKD